MLKKSNARSDQGRETQLHAIRDLMLSASQRGVWLTLGEIARRTEIGEASISAQLRHLRKRRHGCHRVEKRVRPAHPVAGFAHGERSKAQRRRSAPGPTIWEYRVLPAAELEVFARGTEREAAAERISAEIGTSADLPGFIEGPRAEERCVDVVAMHGNSGEVSDAEARD